MSITQTLVNGGLSVARLPLTVAEATLGRGAPSGEWPPAMAFDGFGASVKELVGSITHDEGLLADSRLRRAKVAELRRGIDLETTAETKVEAAEREHQARRATDERRRQAVAARAEGRREAADEQRAAQQRETDARLARERKAAAEAEQHAEAAAAKRERAARAERLRAERDALTEDERARAAEARVDQVSDALEATRRRRKRTR